MSFVHGSEALLNKSKLRCIDSGHFRKDDRTKRRLLLQSNAKSHGNWIKLVDFANEPFNKIPDLSTHTQNQSIKERWINSNLKVEPISASNLINRVNEMKSRLINTKNWQTTWMHRIALDLVGRRWSELHSAHED